MSMTATDFTVPASDAELETLAANLQGLILNQHHPREQTRPILTMGTKPMDIHPA